MQKICLEDIQPWNPKEETKNSQDIQGIQDIQGTLNFEIS